MSPDVIIRPLEAQDVAAAADVARAALDQHVPDDVREHLDRDADLQRRRTELRVDHLRRTDPGGAWVAERDGEVAAISLALLREDLWGLSLLAVAPGLQSQGIGARVLAPALGYGAGARGAIILSSPDPRAMRRYARAGFRVKPCLAAAGPMNRSRVPGGLRTRPGDPERDRDLIDRASRAVRGASHAPDLGASIEGGGELLVLDGRGFALHRDGSPFLLAALDDDAARDLLWSCLAAAQPGATVHVDFISEGNDWAIDVALDAGLTLGPDGPVFVRGDPGPLRPYLPSGAYL